MIIVEITFMILIQRYVFQITVLALIASVTAEPYIYGAPIYAPSAAYTSAAYTAPALPAAYTPGFPAAYPGYPAAYSALPAYSAGLPAAYTAGLPAAYTAAYPAPYSAGLPVPAISAYGSSYSVEELAPLVNSPSAPLVYAPPYSPLASYVYGR